MRLMGATTSTSHECNLITTLVCESMVCLDQQKTTKNKGGEGGPKGVIIKKVYKKSVTLQEWGSRGAE